ncbi:MAG TPA: hypothetical protein VK926_05830 [Gaiellaceae bacterium]|nr:hypothetical protein [Gaiellaceae bacterium]
MEDRRDLTLAFGPVGLAGWAFLLLGILSRSRLLSLVGFAGVVADVTVAELGGFKAMNETRTETSVRHD